MKKKIFYERKQQIISEKVISEDFWNEFFMDVVPNLEQSLDHCSYCTYGFVGEQLVLQKYLTPSERGFPNNQKLSAITAMI